MLMTLVACGAGDDSMPTGSGSATQPISITTGTQGMQAASQILQTREVLSTSAQLFKNIADIAFSVMTPALPNQNIDISCADGGSFQYSGTYTNGIYSLTLTFNGCRDKGYQYVGTAAANGTTGDATIILGGGTTLNIFNFNAAYTVLFAYLKANLSFIITGSGTSTDAAYSIISNGAITCFDYFLLDTYEMRFLRLSESYTLITNTGTLDQTITVTSNGRWSESWMNGTRYVSINAIGFTSEKTRLYDFGSGTFSAENSSLTGTISYTIRPSSFGLTGLLGVAATTPVHTEYLPQRQTNQGNMLLNDTTSIQYDAAGNVDVIVPALTPVHFSDEYSLMKTVDFSAMEQNKPPLVTPPTVGSPISLSTGSTMAITLTWTGPAPSYRSTSDMDLHVKYYSSTSPTSASTASWHLDYGSGKTCNDPLGIAFSDGYDLGGTSQCDIGLDFDDVNGYGPEHITQLRLPSGYYILSVNSFALPAAEIPTSLYLSLHIGDNIYGPYTGSLSTADGNGSTTGAWYRVSDIRVNGDGSITILAPDTTLTPWH